MSAAEGDGALHGELLCARGKSLDKTLSMPPVTHSRCSHCPSPSLPSRTSVGPQPSVPTSPHSCNSPPAHGLPTPQPTFHQPAK